MKKMSILAAVMAAAITVSMTGCGSGSGPAQTEPSEQAPEAVTAEPVPEAADTEADTQNPVMNYIGAYSDESNKDYHLLIQPIEDSKDGVYVTIGHYDESDYIVWDMYGSIKDNVITYKNAICSIDSYDPESEAGYTHEIIYTDGTGEFAISEDKKITWKDDKENKGDGLVFVWDQALNDQVQEMLSQDQGEETEPAGLMAMDWVGPYKDINDESLSMEISSPDENDVLQFVIIKRGEGDTAQTWTMSGTFKSGETTVAYTDCEKRNDRVDEFGNVEPGEKLYENGTGTFTYDEETLVVTWKDDKEDAGKDVQFVMNFNAADSAEGSHDGYELMEGEMLDEPGEDFPAEEEG